MVKTVDFTEKVPVTQHLIELKNRMVQVALVVALFFGVCFYFIDFLLLWLEDPLPKQYADLTFITPTEPFFTASQLNPFFYLIDGFRYGFIGKADGSLIVGIIVVLAINLVIGFLVHHVLRKGWRLKT